LLSPIFSERERCLPRRIESIDDDEMREVDMEEHDILRSGIPEYLGSQI